MLDDEMKLENKNWADKATLGISSETSFEVSPEINSEISSDISSMIPSENISEFFFLRYHMYRK